MNNWKNRLGVVFSTNPDFDYSTNADEHEEETLPDNMQKLRVSIEKKGRGGKTVTLVKGFVGGNDDIRKLEKMLKAKCGVGGSSKDGIIILQGEMKDKVVSVLKGLGYSNTK